MRKLEAKQQWVCRWEVESRSDPNKTYTVAMSATGTWACSCPGWKFKKAPRPDCAHIKRVKGRGEPADTKHVVATINGKSVELEQPHFVLQTKRRIKLED